MIPESWDRLADIRRTLAKCSAGDKCLDHTDGVWLLARISELIRENSELRVELGHLRGLHYS